MQFRKHLFICLMTMMLAIPASSWAAVTFSFNWYCAGCSKIGARTTGTEGPFSSKEACESARSSMESAYRRHNEVHTMPCDSHGFPDTPRSSGSSSDRNTGGYQYQPPPYDYEAERRDRERQESERQRAEENRRKAEAERQRKFLQERDAAVRSLKGGSSAPFGIKGNPDGDLKLKDIGSSQTTRNIPTAWKQLHCAASLSIDAIQAAKRDIPDIEEVRLLGQEAIKALNGEPIGVVCTEAPEPPAAYGKSRLEKSAMLKFYADLVRDVENQAVQIAGLKQRIAAANAQRAKAMAELSQLKNHLVPAKSEIIDLPDYSELYLTPDTSASLELPDYSELFLLPVAAAPDKAHPTNQKLIIGFPSMPKLDPKVLSVPEQLLRQTAVNLDGVKAYLSALSDQSIQRLNLTREAVADYLAKINPENKNRAQALNDFWFAESLRRTREELARKESAADKAIWDSTVAKINERRQQDRTLAAMETTRAEGERKLDLVRERLMDEEAKARRAAFERARTGMSEEYDTMRRNGLLRPGENMVEKERKDPAFRKEMAAVTERANHLIDTEAREAHQRAIAALAAETRKLQQQGLLPDPMEIAAREPDIAASARQIMAEHDTQIIAAHQRSIRELTNEFNRLKSMQPQMLKRAEDAIRETDKLIRDYQQRTRNAAAALERQERSAQEALTRPDVAFSARGAKQDDSR